MGWLGLRLGLHGRVDLRLRLLCGGLLRRQHYSRLLARNHQLLGLLHRHRRLVWRRLLRLRLLRRCLLLLHLLLLRCLLLLVHLHRLGLLLELLLLLGELLLLLRELLLQHLRLLQRMGLHLLRRLSEARGCRRGSSRCGWSRLRDCLLRDCCHGGGELCLGLGLGQAWCGCRGNSCCRGRSQLRRRLGLG